MAVNCWCVQNADVRCTDQWTADVTGQLVSVNAYPRIQDGTAPSVRLKFTSIQFISDIYMRQLMNITLVRMAKKATIIKCTTEKRKLIN